MVEPASASARVLWPDKGLIFAAFLAVGGLLGFIAFGLKSYFSEEAEHVDLDIALGLDEEETAQRWIKKDARNNNKKPRDKDDSDAFSLGDAAE